MRVMLEGAMISVALIIAIGAQNAFVLKYGLLKKQVFFVVLTCFLCDFILMTLGVMGLGTLIGNNHIAVIGMSLAGALFLLWYGSRSFISAWRGGSALEAQLAGEADDSIKGVILTTLGVTLLNPHVYLDTVVVIGGVASPLSPHQKLQFLGGALIASFSWFFALGYGARFLIPLFKNPGTWRILDVAIGCFMFWIAFQLIKYGANMLLLG